MLAVFMFLLSAFAAGLIEALWVAVLAFAVTLLIFRILIDVHHRKLIRALDEISEETLWHEGAVCFGDQERGFSQGLLALTQSRLIYIPVSGRTTVKLEVPLAQILHVEFGDFRRLPCAKVTQLDGAMDFFSMSKEIFDAFAERVRGLKRGA